MLEATSSSSSVQALQSISLSNTNLQAKPVEKVRAVSPASTTGGSNSGADVKRLEAQLRNQGQKIQQLESKMSNLSYSGQGGGTKISQNNGAGQITDFLA